MCIILEKLIVIQILSKISYFTQMITVFKILPFSNLIFLCLYNVREHISKVELITSEKSKTILQCIFHGKLMTILF